MSTPKPKSPSLKRVARTYRKTQTPKKIVYDGGRTFDENGRSKAIISSVTPGQNSYKPKAKSVTLGGSSKSGKPQTKRKTGRV
jgi:hypothetical protein